NMTFTGTSSLGTSYSYQGNVSLAPDGRLVYMYGGTATTISGQPITQSGVIQQVPGTYFTETAGTAGGNYQQAATTSGPLNILATQDSTSLSGKRTMYPSGPSEPGTDINTKASFASAQTSNGGTFSPTSGSINLTLQGVVAGAAWETKWGVASLTPSFTPAGSTEPITRPTINGPVTIGTDLKLTGQFVDQIPNSFGSFDKLSRNLVSVTGTGQTTSSFVQTVGGDFSQTATNNGTQATAIAPALTGTATGTLSGPVGGTLIINSQTGVPSTFGTNSGTISAHVVGVVGGPAGGVQTGVGSTQVIRTITSGDGAGGIRLPRFEGTTVLTPAAGSTPPTLTTTLNGVLNVAPNGASTTQSGVLATTPKTLP
ncbi:MAG: hypothetical protein ABIG94_01250, partial [Pseudomonadota bacterium]